MLWTMKVKCHGFVAGVTGKVGVMEFGLNHIHYIFSMCL